METFSAKLAISARNSTVPVNSPRKGQWRGALMFSLICVWMNDWVNNREAGDLRRYRTHYDVIVMVVQHDIRNKKIYCFTVRICVHCGHICLKHIVLCMFPSWLFQWLFNISKCRQVTYTWIEVTCHLCSLWRDNFRAKQGITVTNVCKFQPNMCPSIVSGWLAYGQRIVCIARQDDAQLYMVNMIRYIRMISKYCWHALISWFIMCLITTHNIDMPCLLLLYYSCRKSVWNSNDWKTLWFER